MDVIFCKLSFILYLGLLPESVEFAIGNCVMGNLKRFDNGLKKVYYSISRFHSVLKFDQM